VFLYSVLQLLVSMSVGCAITNFKINAIKQMFTVKKRENKKSKYGRMKLTTCQHLRLLCLMTLPIEQCCRPGKEKKTKRTDVPEVHSINEGGEQIDTG
jgi:hypothetical protein